MAASAPGPASGFLSPAAAPRPSGAPLPPEPGPTTELRRPLTLVAAHVQQLQSSLEAYKQHLDGLLRAKEAVAADFVRLLRETSAWSLAVLHQSHTAAVVEAARAHCAKLDTDVFTPLEHVAQSLDTLRAQLDTADSLADRHRGLRESLATAPSEELEEVARVAQTQWLEAYTPAKAAVDGLFPRQVERFGEAVLRAFVDGEADVAAAEHDAAASWSALAGRTGSARMAAAETDPLLRFASNVWLYVANLNRDMLRGGGGGGGGGGGSGPSSSGSSASLSRRHSRHTSVDLHFDGSDGVVVLASSPTAHTPATPSPLSTMVAAAAVTPAPPASSPAPPSSGMPPRPAITPRRRTVDLSAEHQLQRYKDAFGRNPVTSLAVPAGFEAIPQVARHALAGCCHAHELDSLLRFQAMSLDEMEQCRLRDLAACNMLLNGRHLRPAANGDDIRNRQAKEDAIRAVLAETNAAYLAGWSPGRTRSLVDFLSRYIGGTHALSSSRIAVQLLFGRRDVVDFAVWRSVPSLDKADIQRPYTLQIEAGSASIGIPITWWIVEARPPKAAATPGHSRQGSTPGHSRQGSGAGHSRQGSFAADAAATDAGRPADGAGAEEVDEDEGSDKYKILGIVDTTYTLRIPIDDAWTPLRAVMATVFINRRGATAAGSMRKAIKAAPRTWMDRTGSFRVDAELKEINDGKVHLLKQNGVRVAVPLDKLSKVDLYHLNMMTGLDIAAYLDRDDSPVSFGAWRSAMPKLAATPPV